MVEARNGACGWIPERPHGRTEPGPENHTAAQRATMVHRLMLSGNGQVARSCGTTRRNDRRGLLFSFIPGGERIAARCQSKAAAADSKPPEARGSRCGTLHAWRCHAAPGHECGRVCSRSAESNFTRCGPPRWKSASSTIQGAGRRWQWLHASSADRTYCPFKLAPAAAASVPAVPPVSSR